MRSCSVVEVPSARRWRGNWRPKARRCFSPAARPRASRWSPSRSRPPAARLTPRWSTPSIAAAVDDYLAAVVEQAGSIDIEFNATGPRISEYGHGKPAIELSVEEFMTAVATVVRSQFITARAAARQMVEQASGVIIFLTAIPARLPVPGACGHRRRVRRSRERDADDGDRTRPCRRQGGLPADPRQSRHAIDSGQQANCAPRC